MIPITRTDGTPGHASRLMRVAGIVLVFMILGPPVGAIAFMATTALVGVFRSTDIAGMTWIALLALIYAVPLSYLFGIVPATAAGLVVGIRLAYFGPATWIFAAVTGLLTGGGMLAAMGQRLAETDVSLVVILAACMVPTLLCWWLVRGWHGGPRPVDRSA